MPLRRAVRWFSELCGLCVGLVVTWCVIEINQLNERVDGIQRTIKNPVVQNNNQQVFIEDPRTQLIKEIATQNGWKPDVNRKLQSSTTEPNANSGSKPANMPAAR